VYRFVARGESPTTAHPPWTDVGEGLRAAIRNITQTTSRALLDEVDNLLTPERADRSGVNSFVASTSAGKPMRTVLVGLVPDVSLESALRAAEDTYLHIEDVISLADGRTREQQVDTLLAVDPDLIIVVGGTDGGATHAMVEQLRTVTLGCLLNETGRQPLILFAGNTALQNEVKEQLEDGLKIDVLYADNVRPSLTIEQLEDAKTQLAGIFEQSRVSGTPGFQEVDQWSEAGIMPTARAFGRVVHFMGRRVGGDVLGVDVGSANSTVAASLNGVASLRVCSDLGVGQNAKGVLDRINSEHLLRWLVHELDDKRDAVNYAWNKSLYPATVPQTPEELELELALAREVTRAAIASARHDWYGAESEGVLPPFAEIIVSGGVFGKTPHPGYSALVLLDAIQPVGVTQLWLDAHGVAAALGSAASLDARAVVEVVQNGGFVNLGIAVCPVGRARRGQVVLRAQLVPEGETEGQSLAVRAGSIAVMPLQPGQRAQLTLQPRGVDIKLPRRARTFEVTGGALGVIIDARGRPLNIPRDAEARQEAMRDWRATLVGEIV
jgi:uncharacterized protein (TIGR01319 family)